MNVGIHQKASPIRFAFLIKPDDEESIKLAIQLSYSIWGGIYSPILFFYDDLPSKFRQEYNINLQTLDYYISTIDNFDPDVILFDDGLDEEKIRRMISDREMINIKQFCQELEEDSLSYGISITKLLETTIEKEFKFKRTDELKISISKNSGSDLFIQALTGSISDALEERISLFLKGKDFFQEPTINYTNLNSNYPTGNVDLYNLNISHLHSWGRSWLRGEGIYFLNETSPWDIVNFWNLRALGWNIAAIPINKIEDQYFKGLFLRVINFVSEKGTAMSSLRYLVSTSITKEQGTLLDKYIRDVANEKRVLLSYQGWFPRYWSEKRILDADQAGSLNVVAETSFKHIESKENSIEFVALNLPFKLDEQLGNSVSYKLNFSFSYYDEFSENAGVISGIQTKEWRSLTYSHGFKKWRLSKNGVNYYTGRDDDHIRLNIPRSIDFFRYYFGNRNHSLEETSNGKLAKEVLKNIGGIRGTYLFNKPSSLKVIELFENGKIIPMEQLIAEIKKNSGKSNDNDYSTSFIERLLDNKIVEVGANIKCNVCHQHGFFLPRELNDNLSCPICRNTFGFPAKKPSEIKWAYRGIGPFSRNNKVDGVLAVFLSLHFFNEHFAGATDQSSSIIGFRLIEKKTKIEKEVDLAVLVGDKHDEGQTSDLLLCECKTYKRLTAKDTERLKQLADSFPNAVIVFATLNESLEPDEISELVKLVTHFREGEGERPKNPLLILTAKELLPKNDFQELSDYDDKLKPYHHYNDYIGNLCEFTVEKHLQLETWGAIQGKKWQAEMALLQEEREKEKAKK